MSRPALTYLATLLAVGVLDYLWLRIIARQWYEQGMGALLAPQPNLWAAAGFYFLYPVGIVIFGVLPAGGEWPRALLMGALFGLFCYGTYDLTALAVLKGYPGWLAALDIAWGTFVSAAGALAGVLAWRALTAS